MAIVYNFASYYAIKKEREELKKKYYYVMSEIYPNLTHDEIKEIADADEIEPVLDHLIAKHRLKEYFLIV
ncbi:hypothetical protein AXJ14_gp188 [Geobacillus virus E3]|jgi:hypothetical protein|uniref:hypothetical protein n=1 Tax=Geobacillus virus E3 TaxID=1572712 RepID=UPI000671CD46|nr:hypothetical protein AXJ14_gp188 [Geobacillus virus E3]AJA41507.1 hypothetical protein E3_0188 [Geobacillus virus E3]